MRYGLVFALVIICNPLPHRLQLISGMVFPDQIIRISGRIFSIIFSEIISI